ncbi:Serine carboxypeptidase-like 34 [Artemisia annua]|uniref:Serine carboxypeptidase-like 34 n=1 Tax=Artemisia annua TaxID=35608 RepID=A0A2U1MQB3_ARTAN|nr:Serine carboxypeptidase-like 34 [Artemisia annua]
MKANGKRCQGNIVTQTGLESVKIKTNKIPSRVRNQGYQILIRFNNVGDVAIFERRLKTILIGSVPLVINRAKFVKVGSNGPPSSDFPPMNPGAPPKTKSSRPAFNLSFKDAVAGLTRNNHVKISIEEDRVIRAKLDCCWTGKAKNFHFLLNAWDIVANNGLDDCNIKYVGDSALKSLEENKCWLNQWFDDIKPWEEAGELSGRLTWMVIEGLPILGRNLAAVKAIAGRFGRLLEVGRLNFDFKIITPVKTLILTYNMRDVSQRIDVVLNNKSYPVRIFEEPFVLSSLLRDHKGNLDNDSVEDSMFEEEANWSFHGGSVWWCWFVIRRRESRNLGTRKDPCMQP